MMARELLVDSKGEYVGDDNAIFAKVVTSDNDTRAPFSFIRQQNEIIGTKADDVAEHLPDKGHVMKCQNNAMFKIRQEDKSYSGVNLLSNLRIKSLVSDIKEVVDDYEKNGYGEDIAREACIKQLETIVTHQCGDHTHCQHEKWCSYLKVKNAHPDWSEDEIAEEAALTSSRPHGGKNMSLSKLGIEKLTSKILARFNSKTIDKIAGGGCSNLSENFWGVGTKFSKEKRLNFDHTDAYIISNKLTFCRIGVGNIEDTHDNVSARLGLNVTSPECAYLTSAGKKRAREKIRQRSDAYKQSRIFAKLSKDHRMGKVDACKLH